MRLIPGSGMLFLIALCQPAFPAPIVTSNASYYSIYGDTAGELRAEMLRKGPIVDGKRYDAATRYHVNWHYDYQQENSTCKLRNIRVTASINYEYPKWTGYDTAWGDVQRAWDVYIANLRQHEHGHAMNGLNAANEIDEALAQMPAMANCKMLEMAANQKAYDILAKYKRADADYDRETNNGITQGVVLTD